MNRNVGKLTKRDKTLVTCIALSIYWVEICIPKCAIWRSRNERSIKSEPCLARPNSNSLNLPSFSFLPPSCKIYQHNPEKKRLMKIHVDSETAPLQSVIVGYPDNFLQVEPEIINETQRRFYFGPNSPTREAVTEQLNGFIDVLKSTGVTVFQPRPLSYLPDQMMTRDIGIVLGNDFIVTTMAAESRRLEWRGYAWLFELFPQSTEIIFAPEDIVIEGGDVVVDKGKIFVGIGQRTTLAGAAWLMQNAPQFEIVPINLKALEEGVDVLHLDCSFLPVGDHIALIYADGLRDIPAAVRESYEFIEVTREEQQSLATNVLSISPEVVISRPTSTRINKLLTERGLEVIEVYYPDPPKTGGSFRCCTLPLFRGDT